MKITVHEIAGIVRTLSRSAGKPHFTSTIIAAAGSGTRMKSADGSTKQLLELCGMPVIVRTLLAFQQSELISEIIVAARADEVGLYDNFKSSYNLTKLKEIVAGGETRQESVLRGFQRISDKSEFVAIHDGARCLIGTDAIDRVIRAAYGCGAATAAAKVVDTVKKSDFSGFIKETLDRDSIWLAGTPQVFKTELYRAAAFIAKDEDFAATDDNMLAERLGFPVKLVDCGNENIKLTVPADLAVAETILRQRGQTS